MSSDTKCVYYPSAGGDARQRSVFIIDTFAFKFFSCYVASCPCVQSISLRKTSSSFGGKRRENKLLRSITCRLIMYEFASVSERTGTSGLPLLAQNRITIFVLRRSWLRLGFTLAFAILRLRLRLRPSIFISMLKNALITESALSRLSPKPARVSSGFCCRYWLRWWRLWL